MNKPINARPAPVADWVDLETLYQDPFPIYKRLRREGGVHWVPCVNRYLITSYDAVITTEHDQATYSANEKDSLQIRAMGHSMLRRDDPEHYRERRQWQTVFKPNAVKNVWTQTFHDKGREQLARFIDKGPGADLIWDFAAPFAAECLKSLLGLYNASAEDLQRWSQTLIDATGNYGDDPEVWAAGRRSFDEVDVALDEMLAWHLHHRDHSLISSLLSSPEEQMPLEKIRANIKMSIGGGLNEPRDALGVAAWAMLTHPDQRRAVERDPSLWPTVFDETIRWVAPIGLYSRQTTKRTVLAGVELPEGARLGICILSANRDESIWDRPDAFDIHREVKPHLAFSKGTHVCLGARAARAEIADVALPLLFNHLNGLELHPYRAPTIGGWVFRGMLSLPVTWHDVRPLEGSGVSMSVRGQVGSAAESEATPHVAIVGAGPAGCFTAKEIQRRMPGAHIDLFDRLPVPYGLLRYGVAGDHQGTKAVARQFDRLFDSPKVRFIGNTTIGQHVTVDDLRASYDAVVLASGVHADRRLEIPGDALARVYGAGCITRRLNGHPDETETPRLGRRVAIIGQGNVAIDVLRLLSIRAADLEGSDIDDAVHGALTREIDTLHIIGRSNAQQARFDPVMIRELSRFSGIEHRLHGVDLDSAPEGKDARLDTLRTLPGVGRVEVEGAPRMTVEWWFEAVPERIDGQTRVEGVVLYHHEETVALAVDAVITAIGFVPDPADAISSALSELPAASETGRVEAGLYLAGWRRHGARGTIPDQRTDARALAGVISADIAAGEVRCQRDGLVPHSGATDIDGWRRIDHLERMQPPLGRVRTKLATLEALLAAARDESLVVEYDAQRTTDGGDRLGDLTISILFGTESGNAELVAEELEHSLDGRCAVSVADLADTDPPSLDPERFYLIVCSTYGDGEVPSGARGFYQALRDDAPDLGGIRFASLGLGDSSYARTYSRGSERLTEALIACGATQIGEYGRHDASGALAASDVALDWAEGVLALVASEEKRSA
ncbi:cytochrome P450 [Halomonas janggokensis]|uniref:Cytochrome P450 n=1 Tax=Vreelandella janggokensis TaxID=370767 RepID=A0ABT4IV79_9GAMM|nr:cytochrome P450 [Halomonas janggokensis]MCZ0927582.1 cytochrome P450 [Halomonas janggokensis]MCZ0930090.1 cytochrome P450 [Halomonas janggokensis]